VNALNLTTPYWADLWLFDHTDEEWVRVANYTSTASTMVWLNYTIDTPSEFIASDGSIDVVVAGPHTESNLLLNPGQIFTDYIAVEVVSVGEMQYPRDVVLSIDGTEILTMPDNVTVPRAIGDAYGFRTGLQGVLDEYPVVPANVTLTFDFAIPSPNAGMLVVRDLLIRYEPVVNEAPSFTGPSTVHVEEDSGRTAVLDLDLAFDDDFNKGELAFEVLEVDDSEHPGAVLASVSAPVGENTSLYVTPDLDFFGGPVNVTLGATDAFGASVTTVISVVVDPVGDRPVLETGGTMEAFENSPFRYTFTATDVDLPDDEFTFSDTSDYFDVDPVTGELNWTPSQNQIGEHRFGVIVTDSFGLEDQEVFTINVRNSNDPPLITSQLTLDAVEDDEAQYTIRADDPDVPFGDVLTFNAYTDGLDLEVDQSTGRITFTPGNAQVPGFEITLRVQDTIGITDEQVLVVTVENVNDPPVFANVTGLTYDQGTEVSYQLMATDPDMDVELPVPETLTFSGTGDDALLPDGTGLISFTPDQSMVGVSEATYTVRDAAGLQDVITITWTIVDVNDGPVISTQLPDELDEDELFSATMEATDADGHTVTWSDDTELFDIDPATGAFEFTPSQEEVGDLLVTLTADDGHGGVTMLAWDATVVNVNDDPVIAMASPESGESYEEGAMVRLSASATDEDGDTLTYTWMDGSKLLGTGRSLEVDDLSPGKHTITLLVEDGNGGEATQDIKVEVTASGISLATLSIIVLVVVLVAVAGAVLFMRSRSAASRTPPAPEEDAEEEEEVIEKVTFKETKVLEYETEGLAERREGGAEVVEEPIYDLEKAHEFTVDEAEKGGE
jgi:hypothetical protein